MISRERLSESLVFVKNILDPVTSDADSKEQSTKMESLRKKGSDTNDCGAHVSKRTRRSDQLCRHYVLQMMNEKEDRTKTMMISTRYDMMETVKSESFVSSSSTTMPLTEGLRDHSGARDTMQARVLHWRIRTAADRAVSFRIVSEVRLFLYFCCPCGLLNFRSSIGLITSLARSLARPKLPILTNRACQWPLT